MFLAVDIGGTKTLLASFSAEGNPVKTQKFETNQDYNGFLKDVESNFKLLSATDFDYAVVGIPGRLDRERGRALGYGNLQWPVVPIEADIQAIVGCPVAIENDAKLAGLSEANNIIDEFKNVLYVTIGTGIGTALITDGKINSALEDSEGGHILLEYGDKRVSWEDIASGKAIVKKYGKRAEDINDEASWQAIARDISQGLLNLIVTIEPQVVVIGGGIGQYFERFGQFLEKELAKYQTPLTPIPPLRKASRPEEAVIYGSYELAKEKYASNH